MVANLKRKKLMPGPGFKSRSPGMSASTCTAETNYWAKLECFLLFDPLYLWTDTSAICYRGRICCWYYVKIGIFLLAHT